MRSKNTAMTELVLKAQRGDKEALGTLLIKFRPLIFSTALQTVQFEDEADEVVSQVYMVVIRKLHLLDCPFSFAGWLKLLSRRIAYNYQRTLRFMPGGSMHNIPDQRAYEPDALANAKDCYEQAVELIDHLPETMKETATDFYLGGQTLKEIEERRGIAIGTVKRRLCDARVRLSAELVGQQADDWIDDAEPFSVRTIEKAALWDEWELDVVRGSR